MWQRWRRDGVGRREAKASGIEEGTKQQVEGEQKDDSWMRRRGKREEGEALQ